MFVNHRRVDQPSSSPTMVSNRNNETSTTPIRLCPPNTPKSQGTPPYSFKIKPSLMIKGFTPNKRSPIEKIEEAIRNCPHAYAVQLCKNDDKQSAYKAKQCVRCSRRTAYMCLGCHLPFCVGTIPPDDKIRTNIPEFMKNTSKVYTTVLGKRKMNLRTDENKRRRTEAEISVQFRADCFTVCHLNQIEALEEKKCVYE